MHPCQGNPPRAADWYVTPSLDLSEEYNSNVLFNRFNKLDDFITHVRPRFQGMRDMEASQWKFDVSLNGEKYVSNSALDTLDYNANGSWTETWSPRFQTSFSTLFAHDQTLNTEIEEIGIVSAREDRYRYGADGSGVFSLSERWSLGGGLSARYNDYPDGQSPNLTLLQGNVNPRWQVNERDTAGAVLVFSNADYDNDTLDRTLSANLSWERRLSESNLFSLQAGYRYTSLDQEQFFRRLVLRPNGTLGFRLVSREENFTDGGFVFSGRLVKDWSERLKTAVSAGREHTNASDATAVDRNYIRTTTGFKLTERTSLDADLGYDFTTRLGTTDEDTHYFRASPSLGYQLTPHLVLRVACSYEYALDDRDVDPFSRNRFKTWVALSTNWPRLWGNH